MSKAVWLNSFTWRNVDHDAREKIEKALGELPEEYASNVENQLRIRGEHKLANEMINQLEERLNR